jgi:hypothetical protein
MFSKELESLIQATLEDGKLEDFEKAALAKRAQAEGVDLAELEIYINSLLQRRARELNQKREEELNMLSKQKKEAFGRVCPNCGAQVKAMTLRCDCGYEFTNAKAVSSVNLLYDKLNSVTLTAEEEKTVKAAIAAPAMERLRKKMLTEKKISIISTYPVPNTKEDLLEFLSISVSEANKKLSFLEQKKNVLILVLIAGIVTLGIAWMYGILYIMGGTNTFSEEKLVNAWRAKCEQILLKGRSLRGDAEFTQQLNYFESLLDKK